MMDDLMDSDDESHDFYLEKVKAEAAEDDDDEDEESGRTFFPCFGLPANNWLCLGFKSSYTR